MHESAKGTTKKNALKLCKHELKASSLETGYWNTKRSTGIIHASNGAEELLRDRRQRWNAMHLHMQALDAAQEEMLPKITQRLSANEYVERTGSSAPSHLQHGERAAGDLPIGAGLEHLSSPRRRQAAAAAGCAPCH